MIFGKGNSCHEQLTSRPFMHRQVWYHTERQREGVRERAHKKWPPSRVPWHAIVIVIVIARWWQSKAETDLVAKRPNRMSPAAAGVGIGIGI